MIFVSLYLLAIVLANLSVAYFGTHAVIVNAFLFIGLDLTVRDELHERWNNNYLFPKMTALVLSGSLLSYFLNNAVAQIAMASFVAFVCAGVVDTILYQVLKNKTQIKRVNMSNVGSSLTDSILFPTIAFGSLMPALIVGQFLAKIIGGFVWYIVIKRLRNSFNTKILRKDKIRDSKTY